VTAIAWLSPTELVLSEIHYDDARPENSTRRITRWSTTQPIEQRAEVLRQRGKSVTGGPRFSPDARHVLLPPVPWGQSVLLDVTTGQTRNIGGALSMLTGVAWTNDASALFVALNQIQLVMDSMAGVETGAELLLVDLKAGKATRTSRASGYDLEPRWTADNRYVVDNSGWAGCRLIDPRSGKESDLTKTLVERMKLNGQTTPPELHPLPTPGWLWTRGGDRKSYATDYQAGRFIKIADAWKWAITPDGRTVVELSPNGQVTSHPTALPASPATSRLD
jgi:hypothetical protein